MNSLHDGTTTLDTCLDPAAMRTLLQSALPGLDGAGLAIEQVRIDKARRNTSRRRNPNPLTLVYELALRGGGTRSYYAKVFRDGASAEAVHGTAALWLPALDMLLWRWPADPGLPQLGALLDPAQARTWWGVPASQVDALRHEPGRRATLRYRREGAEPIYAKTFRDERAAQVHQRFEYFWALSRRDALAPTVAEPLGYTADTRAFWQAQARGEPLVQVLRRGAGESLAQRVAQAFALLHEAPTALAGAPPRDRAHWLAEIRRRQTKISRTAPELAARAQRLAEALAAASAELPEPPLVLIHGDCHADQLWVDGERVVLFDFDEFTLGDPMEDLAEFLVKLDAPDRPGEHAAFARALTDHHAAMAPRHHDRRRLRWHMAVQMLLQASRAFVFQVEGWRGELDRRLARAEALCALTLQETRP